MQRQQTTSRPKDRWYGRGPIRVLIAALLLAQALACAAPATASNPIGSGSVTADTFADRVDLVQAGLQRGDDRTAPPGKDYLPYILAGAAAILLEGLLINWLLRERGQRRRSEAEARETMSQLARLNRMATAGELSASIAHELTQPITGMVASANAALRWLSAPTPQIDQARSALARVVSAGDRTREIIHGVRAMFKGEAEERRAIDMNEIVRGVLALVEGDIQRHGIVVEAALEEPAIPVLGDCIQLQQVVLNLTVNAIDSMCAIATRPRLLRLRAAYSRDRVWISIADTGVGIGRDDINRIFKPLYTTKPNGMGMGLSICFSMVEAHKGRIWAAPGDPDGAVFHFVLPTTR
jgi:C4-dicarboxylate-specific signal transduction histidine kinase